LSLLGWNVSNDGLTTIEFIRRHSTGDPNGQDREIHLAHQSTLIWAIGQTKPTTLDALLFGKHSHKGSSPIDWGVLRTCSVL